MGHKSNLAGERRRPLLRRSNSSAGIGSGFAATSFLAANVVAHQEYGFATFSLHISDHCWGAAWMLTGPLAPIINSDASPAVKDRSQLLRTSDDPHGQVEIVGDTRNASRVCCP